MSKSSIGQREKFTHPRVALDGNRNKQTNIYFGMCQVSWT